MADTEITEWAVTLSKGKRDWSHTWINLLACHLSNVNIILLTELYKTLLNSTIGTRSLAYLQENEQRWKK